MQKVAVIGAGPGGIVAARYLLSEGFEPVLYEQGTTVGGQWSGDPGHSGVWPTMRTNSSRVLTAFSDMRNDIEPQVYPTNQAVRTYLQHYADRFGITGRIRWQTRVEEIRRDGDGWAVRANGREEHYAKVVVATGRYNRPWIPEVAGLNTFSGELGTAHTFQYKNPESYRGKRVLVAGSSISALEVATDLVMMGAARVVVTYRKQRYIVPKLLSGVPADHVAFTRFAALAGEVFPPELSAQGFKQMIVDAAGSPDQCGTPKPADNVFEADISLSQYFLPLLTEGRIHVKPWIREVKEQAVHFLDGTVEQMDGIVFGTGFDLHVPFLSEEIRHTLDVDRDHIDLHKFTFHPDLEGLAFVGLWPQAGPYFPVLELQARWIAYQWSGALAALTREEMEAGVARYRSRRGLPQRMPLHATAILFSRAVGVEPDLREWPELKRALLFGPLTAISFRLCGRDALAEAPERVAAEAREFGAIPSSEFSPKQMAQMEMLAKFKGAAAAGAGSGS